MPVHIIRKFADMNFNFLGAETPTDFRGWIQEGFLQPSDGKQGRRRRRRRRRRSKLEIFLQLTPVANALKVLQACIYKSVITGLFLK